MDGWIEFRWLENDKKEEEGMIKNKLLIVTSFIRRWKQVWCKYCLITTILPSTDTEETLGFTQSRLLVHCEQNHLGGGASSARG